MIPVADFSDGDELTRERIKSWVRAIKELQGAIIKGVQYPLTLSAGVLAAVLKDAVAWGSATADWSSGNIVYLHPCDPDGGNANTDAAITGYLACPTGASPAGVQVSAGDVLGYLPITDDSGLIVNAQMGGLPNNSGKSQYMVLQLSASVVDGEGDPAPNDPTKWTIDWVRAH